MKLLLKTILITVLVGISVGANAQDVITGPRKPKKQTTAPAKKTPKKRPQVSAQDLYCKGDEAYNRQDYVEAAKLWRRAADMDYPWAIYRLATMYEKGLGVARNESEAIRLYEKALDNGIAQAKTDLNRLRHIEEKLTPTQSYAKGVGLCNEGEYTEGAKWLRKAAEEGVAAAQNHLGTLYRDGKGVAPDNAEAVEWFSKAAEQGDSWALYNLGQMYENGQGVGKDLRKAAELYQRAANRGNTLASQRLLTM